MYPYIHIILPSYTVMALIGGFVTLCFIYLRLDQFNIQFTSFLSMFFFCVIGGVIGSKVLFALTQIPWLVENFNIENLILLIPQSGFVFYGGLFGVIFTLLFVTRKDRDLRKRIFHLSVPAMPLFHAFGRIGCFLSGCCYGKVLTAPVFMGPIELTRFPVQLVESAAEFILFLVILIIDKKKSNVDILKVYLVLYATIRFFDEFLRGDEVRGIYFGMSTAQWISLLILLYYVAQMVYKRLNLKYDIATL